MTMNELAIEIVRMVVRQTQAMKYAGLIGNGGWEKFVIKTVEATVLKKKAAGDIISVWPITEGKI